MLAVTGLTPQVVTETLFALMSEGRHRLPDEVHVLTTAEGAERVELALLSERPGWLAQFQRDYNLPPIVFDTRHIHRLVDASGQPMIDIRSAQDNANAADQVSELVRKLTLDPDADLHVSLAGGRKTLGFFAGYALSLWGRSGDRLSHVLVDDPFESSWDFFYPTPYERIIETRDRKLADCRHACVTLADIPFVRLRHGLPQSLLAGKARFAQAVSAAQGGLGPPHLTIDRRAHVIEAAGHRVELPPAELAFLAWFARRALLGVEGLPCPMEGVPSLEHAQGYLAEYTPIVGLLGDDERTRRRYRHGMTKGDFEERKSKLKRALKSLLGPAADAYCVVGEGRRPMLYRLQLPSSAIAFAS